MQQRALVNPFAYYAEKRLVVVGLAATAIGSVLGWLFNARFDGVLDLHFVQQLRVWQPLLDNGINILSLTLPLYLFGLSINGKTRLIDVVAAVLVARIPFYVLPLANIGGYMYGAANQLVTGTMEGTPVGMGTIAANIAFFAAAVSAMAVFVFWLFQGFKTATNSKKAAHKWIFGACIVLSEVISKMMLVLVSKI
ncbi:hypothetical protein JHJ32_20500 [Parapedobacter sp. ISTM3]|uniref:hypothetical protein n=1 Tax=Parapedobacter sp. ISTM3 TaxID=2800130 RepID=UPI0019083248|nr:hypothetical protein [Parapedobacter sp. ISTM3]MBK1442391.1 hypothetical protein [Parapedobacter sp. ISTM3]